MIDRFRGPAGPLAAPASPGDRAGGTLDGVRAALAAGYFEALGVTTLWLSPVYTNPAGYELGRAGRPVTPYHGYWPAAPRRGGERPRRGASPAALVHAVPRMPRAAERRMLAALHGMLFRAPQDLLVVGEVYTGPGDAGREQIRAFLGDRLDGLDSAFDFPLMWATRDALAHGSNGGFAT